MRVYQEHWERMKVVRQISLERPRKKHLSIGVLVRREATRDSAYAALLASEGKRFFINHASIGDTLILTLRITVK